MKEPEKAPYFAWQCLTIELKHRVIDLVFPDEQGMKDVLKILVWELETIDGKRGTAKKLKELIKKERRLSVRAVENEVYRKIMLKYTIMKVRSKISYEAFIRNMLINELFFHTILFSLGMISLTRSLGNDVPLIYKEETLE